MAAPGPWPWVSALTLAVASACSPAQAQDTFMGRTLAPTMSHHGAGWLVRPEREEEENPKLLLEQLALEPGDVACDIGAGNGYHTLQMAQAVAPNGKVVAVDIQPQMLAKLRRRAKVASISNIRTVLGTQNDPKLKDETCDLILLVDVYHEFSDPAAMLAAMKKALKPDGRVALVEFRAEDPKVPIKALHKMSKTQMIREFASVSLVPKRQFDGLPWQHLVFFGRPSP